LAFAERRDDVDDPARAILEGWILDLHGHSLLRVEGRQIVEVDLVADVVRVLEIDLIDLGQREVSLAFPRRANATVDRVASAQAKAANLGWADVDVIRARQIVGLRTPKKAEPVLENLQGSRAEDLHPLLGRGLEDGEHHVLFAHGVRIFDIELLGKGEQIGRRFLLQLLQRHPRQPKGGNGFAGLAGLPDLRPVLGFEERLVGGGRWVDLGNV